MRGSRGSAKWKGSWSARTAATSCGVRTSASRAHEACTWARRSSGSKRASSSSTPASQRSEGTPQETTVPAWAGSAGPTRCERATKAPKEWPEDDVALELERRRQGRDVRGHALDGPRRRRGGLRAALRALVDEEQPVVVGDRVQPPAELRVVEAGAAVQRDHPQRPGPALLDVQAGVADVDEAGHGPSVPGAGPPTAGL